MPAFAQMPALDEVHSLLRQLLQHLLEVTQVAEAEKWAGGMLHRPAMLCDL